MDDVKIIEQINQSSLKFLEPLEPEEMFKTIVEEAKKLVKAEHGSILLAEDGNLKRVYASDLFFNNIHIRDKGFTYRAFKSHQPFVVDVESVENFHKAIVDQGVKSIIQVPLSYRKKSIGVLTVHSLKAKHFTTRELHILKLFGSMASLAIRKMQSYEETKKALETRDLFISLASHELRTPLTTLNGYIQMLYMKLGKQETNEGKWIRELYTESGRLTNLVKELLEVNRIKQGQLQFSLEECKLTQIITNAMKRISLGEHQREIVFINTLKEREDLLIGDCEKLLQMFTALISNAVKFSPENTTVTIEVRSNAKQLSTLIIDKGEGIESRDLPYIFDEFYKGSNHQKEGMGVGLLLAKHIIAYHKGSITVKSKVKKGTTIEVKLPKGKV